MQFLFAGCLGLSSSISLQFTLEICAAATNCKKNHYNRLFWGFKVIDVDSTEKLVTIACYDKQHVCAYLQPEMSINCLQIKRVSKFNLRATEVFFSTYWRFTSQIIIIIIIIIIFFFNPRYSVPEGA